jgi:hypothetical protein
MPEEVLSHTRGVPSAREMNKLLEAIRKLQSLTMAGHFTSDNTAIGRNFNVSPNPPVFAQITGGANPYSWSYVAPKPNGGGWIVTATGGSVSACAAYEVTGATDVPTGHIVELFPGFQGDKRFQLVRSGGCSTQICVSLPCGAGPAVGALVEIYTGSTLVDSCTTGSTGCCTLPECGTYTLKIYYAGVLVYNVSRTLNGTTISITISTSDTNLDCCGTCAIPYNLTLIDSNGSIPFLYDGGTWLGSYTITLPNVLNPSVLNCTMPLTVISAGILVTYQGTCVEVSPGNYQFQVTQYFNYLFASTVGSSLLWAGTFGASSCTWSCATPPPVPTMYYTSGAGFAYYTATAAWTTCSPFLWAGTMPATVGGGACGSTFSPTFVSPAPGTVTVSY